MHGTGVKRHRSGLPVLLIVIAASCGAAHAGDAPDEVRDEVEFRPWIGALGVHFPSESLFEEPRLSDDRHAPSGLSGQTSTAGLQGLGLGGEWRPFQNGFRLNFAMYLDSNRWDESDGFRPRNLSVSGLASEDPVSLSEDFEVIPYVGLGWQTNNGGLDVNLDVGAFLPGEAPLRDAACLDPDSPLIRCGAGSFGNDRGRLTDYFRKFEWYPLVSLGIGYRF